MCQGEVVGLIGRNVYTQRTLIEMPREDLAAAVGRSCSWLEKIETGHLALDSWRMMHTIAAALGVDVAALTGQPYQGGGSRQLSQAAMPGLRRALLAGADLADGLAPASPAELRVRVTAAHMRHHAGRHGELAESLPSLLTDLHRAVAADCGPIVAELLAEAYAVATHVTYRLGHLDLAAIAAERGVAVAGRGEDPLRVVAGIWVRTGVLRHVGGLSLTQHTTTRALARLDAVLGTQDLAVWSLWGSLHLAAALTSARQQDRARADTHIAEADQAAARTGERDDYGTVFGPSNVAVHRIAIAVELGEGGRVVPSSEARASLLASLTTRERRSHFLVDVARATYQSSRRVRAWGLLRQADRLAPALVRHYPPVVEMVSTGLLGRGPISDDLRTLGRLMGLIPAR